MTTCLMIDTPIIKESLGYARSRQSQVIDNTLIVGMDEYGAYAKHWYESSWLEDSNRLLQIKRRKISLWRIKRFLRNPTVMNYLERDGETKLSKLYIFLVYDFLDNGPGYYIKRLAKKVRNKING